ncbi:hypothetical protein IAT38_003617 [Cryptococcus sp. DSM 104549]
MVRDETAETSKAGSRRMRSLQAQPPSLRSNSSAAIHPTTSRLIYPAPSSSTLQGYLTTPIFAPTHPSFLSTSSILTPGKQLSISPSGEWVVVFHPNLSDGTGAGTVAVYPSTILSPVATSASVVPFATLPLDSEPLATTHICPPRTHLPHSRTPPSGPRPPSSYSPSHAPAFLILTSSHIHLFYPQGIPASTQLEGPVAWTISSLRCPLHTRWHAAPGGAAPPDNGKRARRGWMGIVPGNEGVWAAWEEGEEVGVVRGEVGVDRLGRYYLQTTPMPSLPRVKRPAFEEAQGEDKVQSELQGVAFVSFPAQHQAPSDENESTMAVDDDDKSTRAYASTAAERVGAVLVYQDAVYPLRTTTRTRLELHSFERRAIELAVGFSDIATNDGDIAPMWDWCTVPSPIRTIISPTQTSLIALHPLPTFNLLLALIAQPSGLSLIHLNLGTDTWKLARLPIEIGAMDGDAFELVVSQGVEKGQMGLVGVLGEKGVVLTVVPRLDEQPVLGDEGLKSSVESSAADAATSIILAEREGSDWSDVVRAVCGYIPKTSRSDLLSAITRRIYRLAEEEVDLDALDLLFRVQVAFFSATQDPRLVLATDVLRLNQASNLVDKCATFGEDGGISFDLDSIWPLIGVMEWVMGVLASAMREAVVYGAAMEWEGSDESALSDPSPLLLLAHPTLRALTLRLLSQLSQLTTYLTTLERPILPPETKLVPAPIEREAGATVVARERMRDVALREGVDLQLWGKSLESLSTDLPQPDLESSLTTLSLTPLTPLLPGILTALPRPSSLFAAQTQSLLEPDVVYDLVDWRALPSLPSAGDGAGEAGKKRGVKCERCHGRTEALRRVERGEGKDSPWTRWKAGLERGCGCGGTWVR